MQIAEPSSIYELLPTQADIRWWPGSDEADRPDFYPNTSRFPTNVAALTAQWQLKIHKRTKRLIQVISAF